MNQTEQQLNELLESGDIDAAEKIVNSIDIASTNDTKLLQLGARVHRELNDLKSAANFSSRATDIEPTSYHLAIGNSNDRLKLGQPDLASAVLDGLPDELQSNEYVQLHRGKILYQKRDFKPATKLLVDLVKEHPQFAPAHMELAHCLLMDEKWRAGWEEYEWRYGLENTKNMYPKLKMPLWDGCFNLPHILLIADQGYGDCFQFSRYIPLVAQRCQKVTLIRSKPLARLMDSIPSVTSSHTKWEETPMTSAYCTLSGLPRLFATRPDSIPDCTGVLKASAQDISRWEQKLKQTGNNPKLKIGIAWSGRVEFENNYLRAMPFEKLQPLLEVPEAQFYSIQVGKPASQLTGNNIIDLSSELSDFSETAAAMEALDLIITTDTSIAHLAGTLDRPTWTLLNHAPDWRWNSEGSTSAWYPNTRLFRQDHNRSWDTVIKECKSVLQNIMDSKTPSSALLSITARDEEISL